MKTIFKLLICLSLLGIFGLDADQDIQPAGGGCSKRLEVKNVED